MRRTDFTREEFVAKVWEQKKKSRGNIRAQLERLGASCDWSREAFTMSGAPGAPAGEEGNFHDAVIKVFVDLYDKGLIYRGKRLVNWDPHFETAISDLEVEQTEVDGFMWHFKYPLAGGASYEYVEKDADGKVVLRETRDWISIATTRPETMLGDGAVAVHPSDERYVPIVGKLCEIPVGPKEHRRLIPIITDEYPDPLFGSGAVKITGAHDFNDYAVAQRAGIPLYRLMGTRAQMRDDGAPYAQAAEVAQKAARAWLLRQGHALPGFAEVPFALSEAEADALNLVPDELRGLDRFEARKRVAAAITVEGLAVMTPADDPRLGKPSRTAGSTPPYGDDGRAGFTPPSEPPTMVPLVEAKKIMQPFGDRSKVVIEPMLTDQWYVDTARIVEPALEAVRSGRTKIIPPSGEKTYYHWLENIEPWCISRQLWWGHQIPVWFDSVGNEFCAPTEDEAIQKAKTFYEGKFPGKDVFVKAAAFGLTEFTDQSGRKRPVVSLGGLEPPASFFDDGISDESIDVEINRDPDVLDTWFSSGLWPIGTLGWPEPTPELAKYFPTSVLVTGQDILFFWVARMMMMQLAVVDDVPFHTVYLHGLVRDAKGKKMSKSLGNVIDPLEIIDEYGADALRFANAAMASLGGVLRLDTQRIAGYRNFGTKLWNACRFAEMNGVWEGHTTRTDPPQASATANRWIIGEAARVRLEVDEALAAFRFDQAAAALYGFVWGKVCDWYVEFAKPLFDGPQAGETRAVMAWVLDQSLILLHPIMPFVTEELWQTTRSDPGLLAHAPWPAYGEGIVDREAEREMRWVTGLIDAIRSARAEVHVPVGQKLDLVAVDWDAAAKAAWGRNEALIRRLARVEGLTEGAAPKGSVAIPVEGATFSIPLAGVIDIAAEAARLEKALEKVAKDLTGIRGRLANPQFLASAKEEVVDEARARAETLEAEAAQIGAALARLRAMR